MNTAAEKVQTKAMKMLATLSLKKLCESWEVTNTQTMTIELAMSRRWLQDEFERRDQVKFDAWLDCPDVDKMDHPALFFITK